MKRFLPFITAASIVAAGCRGPRGQAGDEGPAGPITDPPVITSISPASGSSNTIWTLTGANLGTAATATFNGFEATVLSATDTELVVTDAFVPVAAMTAVAVSVERADQMSNAYGVFGFPSGTPREEEEWRVWSTVDDFVVVGGTWYVLDVTRGLYAFDTTTRAFTRLLRAEEPVMGTLAAVDGVGADLYVTAISPDGLLNRVFRLVAGSWVPFANVSGVPLAVLDAGAGRLYVAGEAGIERLDQAGTVDATFAFVAQDAIGGAAIRDGALHVSYPALDKIVSVDETGTQTDFATTGLDAPRAIVPDGSTGLYALAAAAVQTVDGTGTVASFSAQPLPNPTTGFGYDDLRGLARLENGPLLVSAPGRAWLFRMDDATSGTVPVAGFPDAAAPIARVGDETIVLSSDSCDTDPGAGERKTGVLIAFAPGGARMVSAASCSLFGLAESGAGAVLAPGWYDEPRAEVLRIDVATGDLTVLADESDGLTGVLAMFENADGTVFAVNRDPANGDQSSVYRFAPDGTVTPDFVVHSDPSSSDYSLGLAVSGGYLWGSRTDDENGSIGGIYRADLDVGGTWEPVYGTELLQIKPAIDAIMPDGEGGILVTDVITNGLWRIAADGEASLLFPLPGTFPTGLARDDTNGDFLVAYLGGGVVRLMP